MAKVIIAGDGPAGLSSALFLAKRGQETHVFGRNDTPMHYAHLFDYLGVPEVSGTVLQTRVGAELTRAGATVDEQQRTTVDRVYAVGRVVRPDRSQAIISAGAGAVAALDILAREQGTSVVDWDVPGG